MPSSIELSTNWDFTPVINLLRSHTYGGDNQCIPSHRTNSHLIPSSPGEKQTKAITNCAASQKHVVNNESSVPPRLGDFGSLWDLLGHTNTPSINAGQGQQTQIIPSEQPSQPSKPITIFKRPSKKPTVTEHLTKPSLSTPSKPIPSSNTLRSQRLKVEAVVKTSTAHHNIHQTKHLNETSSSESSAEAESDGNLSVFDPPLPKQGLLSLIPPQVGIPAIKFEPCETPPSSFDELDGTLTSETIKNSPRNSVRVQPVAYKSATDRRVGLLTKLLKRFPDYTEIVAQVGRSVKSESPVSHPVHVFVDMSNIMVGFHDCVKISRNIPVKTRIPQLPLSFQNFSLILERGRPAAKRVLVGSDRFAAINESEKLGYETNILDRVHKVKHVTRRQLQYKKNPRVDSHGGSGSETNEMPGERWVEQGVDEILHLKILESLVDTDKPATIVLATGDAAEAEFSGGFLKMVERALLRGWNVELVSFSQVTSSAYRRKEFRAKWGKQFKMIPLDDYIEELLDM